MNNRITQWLHQRKHAARQRKYTAEHRAMESAEGLRLMSLDDHMPPTFSGRRPWCDAVLQECPVPGHDLCCFCTHSERTPAEVLADREGRR